jgi:V/A-type H+-transporting ATPase subunit A
VRLIGEDALPDEQRLVIEGSRLLQEACLQQNANDSTDTFCRPEKQLGLLKAILHFFTRAREIVKRGAPIHRVRETPAREELVRAKEKIPNDKPELLKTLMAKIDREMDTLLSEFQRVR